MRRLRHAPPILLIACVAALGSGALRFAHDAHHAYEDAAAPACHGGRAAHGDDRHDHSHPRHDETNCELHALLNAPLMSGGAVPVLVDRGLFVAFLTLLAPSPARLRLPARIDCRGPPACVA